MYVYVTELLKQNFYLVSIDYTFLKIFENYAENLKRTNIYLDYQQISLWHVLRVIFPCSVFIIKMFSYSRQQ